MSRWTGAWSRGVASAWALPAATMLAALTSCAGPSGAGVAATSAEVSPPLTVAQPAIDGRAPSDPAALAPSVPLHQPLPGVYTAGQPAATDWAAIAAQGVTTVIDLRPSSERPSRDEAAEVAAAGLRYVQIPVADAAGLSADKADLLWQSIDARGGTLVHCASGNRAGALLALAAVRHGAVGRDEVVALGRAAGMTSTEPRLRELLAQPADPAADVKAPTPGKPAD